MSAQMTFAEKSNCTEPVSDFSDFSDELLKSYAEDVVTLTSKPAAGTREVTSNRNISNVISKIRDDGPADGSVRESRARQATTEKKTSGLRANKNMEANVELLNQQSRLNEIIEDTLSISTDEVRHVKSTTDNISTVKSVAIQGDDLKRSRLFVILSGMFSLLMCILFYQLQIQSNEMKETLLGYQQEMVKRDQASHLPENIKTSLSRLDEKLSGLSQEITFVKSDYKQGYKNIDTKLQEQLTTVNDQLLNVKQGVGRSISKGNIVNVTTTQKIISKSSFSVNVASFSEKDKANRQLQKLRAYNMNAVMELVVVNSKNLYRLSVEGFSNRKAADKFIIMAKNKYGFSGWVRTNKS